jgi:hypothetical protein
MHGHHSVHLYVCPHRKERASIISTLSKDKRTEGCRINDTFQHTQSYPLQHWEYTARAFEHERVSRLNPSSGSMVFLHTAFEHERVSRLNPSSGSMVFLHTFMLHLMWNPLQSLYKRLPSPWTAHNPYEYI